MSALPARRAAVKQPIIAYANVPRLWPDSTIVCLGSGPSLTQADVDYVRGRARVIAVNDTYRLAPWADVLYACDAKWWGWHQGVPTFAGLKFALQPQTRWPGVQIVERTGLDGLELKPTGVRSGHNSGYQAINLAVHLGAKRIILLGYDMQGRHFFGSHPDQTAPPFAMCLKRFKTLVGPLAALGIETINATRTTALQCFRCAPLHEVLS